MDDNLDHVRIEWFRRLARYEVSREEAQALLPALKARLAFLQALRSKFPDDAEFAENARYVEREIESQAEEIKVVEEYIGQANRAE